MAAPDYKFPTADCHVDDKPRLEAFRAKRADWLNSMRYDPHHPISDTIAEMVWSDTRFRTFGIIGEANSDSVLNNSLIAEAIIEGYFATQALAIRRLLDGTRSVISITNMLKELRQFRHLFIRENFVSFDGLPYDYVPLMEKSQHDIARSGGAQWLEREGPEAWSSAQMAHAMFDRLSGVSHTARTRTDRIPVGVIDTLQNWVEGSDAESIVNYADNFLAHARDSRRRGQIDLKAIQPTLAKITSACRALTRASEAILAFILYDSGHGQVVPTAQFDKWDKMTSAVMPKDFVSEADAVWDRLARERDEYIDGVREELLGS